MKKIFIFLTFILFLSSCNTNRNDEYSCMFSDGSGPVFLLIKKGIVEWKRKDGTVLPLTIIEEKIDRIVAKRKFKNHESNIEYTLFKKTNKMKVVSKNNTFILSCEKLN